MFQAQVNKRDLITTVYGFKRLSSGPPTDPFSPPTEKRGSRGLDGGWMGAGWGRVRGRAEEQQASILFKHRKRFDTRGGNERNKAIGARHLRLRTFLI